MFKFVCFAALIAVAVAGEVKFSDCAHGEVSKLDLSDCTGDSCTIHKGKDFKLAASFVSNQDTKKVDIKITASVNGLEIPVPGVESNGCNGHLPCPLQKGKAYVFNYSLNIPKLLPDLKAVVHAELVGEHGTLACVKVNGEVKE